jgi:hypothetical protein
MSVQRASLSTENVIRVALQKLPTPTFGLLDGKDCGRDGIGFCCDGSATGL